MNIYQQHFIAIGQYREIRSDDRLSRAKGNTYARKGEQRRGGKGGGKGRVCQNRAYVERSMKSKAENIQQSEAAGDVSFRLLIPLFWRSAAREKAEIELSSSS